MWGQNRVAFSVSVVEDTGSRREDGGGSRERVGQPDCVLELRQMSAEADIGGPDRARAWHTGRGGRTLWDRLADAVAGSIMLPRTAQNESTSRATPGKT